MDERAAAGVIAALLEATIALHAKVRASDLGPVVRAAAAIRGAFAAGGKLLAFGNGGSAADAQHLVAELVGRFERERAGFPAVALTTDSSVLTSVSNDYGFARVFARQIEALGRAGDVAFGISTSGNSPNVLAAIEAAKAQGLVTIALTGRDGGAIGRAAAVHVNVPDASTARVQEVHTALIHAICDLVERD
jgi:D-sedoheptulose 7-phosphate isomerase